ncbi:unnamed protein product [Fraxinus pennsylvanica]|uniref:PWWP domain-containing protein n=1 Tax=Fraxinus pennsylvanica TaxID=56036 RepID=A0AAD2DZF2_9LAMI|nr:unnamed protein product [Fraxinus pennsylvanica]
MISNSDAFGEELAFAPSGSGSGSGDRGGGGASGGKDEAFGHCYRVGDLVWGKVKSHPWWPGHVYNEAFASPSVRRTKHEGHLLVAFFGDSSYGWFDPAELIPFEENFAGKSSQITSRPFLKAVEEAVGEISRRRSLGLACRCRNKYNFWPTTAEGYCNVDVGCYESGGVYSRRQIQEAQESFQPREMLNFVQQLALKPLTDDYLMLNFIKNKATILACRKAFFEAFDETYAQAFGTEPVRPTPPSQPLVVDPAKAALSGRLVIAEALGKGKSSVKSTKTKEQVEKERYLLKTRDERTELKTSESSSGQADSPSQPLMVDRLGISGKVVYSGKSEHSSQTPGHSISEGRELPTSHQASAKDLGKEKLKDDCSGSTEFIHGGKKKAKVHRRPSGDLNTENSVPVEKKRKKKIKHEIGTETSTDRVQIPAAASYGGVAVNNSSGTSVQVLFGEDYRLENQSRNVVGSSQCPTMETMKAVGIGDAVELELPRLLRDLQVSALNPFHGSVPAIVQKVLLKFRSLVYHKSLPLMAPAENESKEARIGKLTAVRASASPDETIKRMPIGKPTNPPIRPEDQEEGGQKRGASDRLKEIAANKRKKIIDLKSMAMEKKAVRKVTEIPRDGKESVVKSVPLVPSKANKLESKKRTEKRITAREPTMLVMKFPPGGALPSISELKAKFARFGPLEHSATRVFWTTLTCRLVYHYKFHAEAAYKFAVGSNNLFGNPNVRCHLRELGVEAPQAESVKVQRAEESVGALQLKDNAVVELSSQPPQHQVQLKSCLKKPSGDEGGNSANRSTASVKSVLGGEESSRVEQLSSNNIPTHSLDLNSKNLPEALPHSSVPLRSNEFQNLPLPDQMHRTTNKDIAQPMLNLLTRCNDVVNNLTGALGYVPYHSL